GLLHQAPALEGPDVLDARGGALRLVVDLEVDHLAVGDVELVLELGVAVDEALAAIDGHVHHRLLDALPAHAVVVLLRPLGDAIAQRIAAAGDAARHEAEAEQACGEARTDAHAS